ncbi:MAG: IS1634 family transposase, partial [Chloroflexota bacterium]|nr:IS1634 family transposase [Chloroflexota bacterium]
MHIETIRHKHGDRVYVSYLLRQTYREEGKIKHRTIANLTGVPLPIIELIQCSLRGEPVSVGREEIRCVRSRSHGAVWAVTAMMKKLGLPTLLGARPEPWHRIVSGMIAARVLAAGSKLFATRWWKTTTLAEDWHLPVDEDGAVEQHRAVNELYKALDALVNRQRAIEKKLAERHLQQGSLVLFDLSSSYLEGRKCPLSAFGHNRDGKKGKQQITYGLLTTREGCPVAIEVFAGNQSDPTSLKPQIERLRNEYGFTDLVVVGDRGMITKTRIADLEAVGLDWLTSLRAPDIQKLHQRGVLQLSLFDQRDLVELHDPEQTDRRLIACRNPLLAEDRARKRVELLADTERELAKIAARVQGGRLKQAAASGVVVGKVINRRKVAKHFRLTIEEGVFAYERDTASIEHEAALDGVYIVTSNVSAEKLSGDEAVAGYK